MNVTDPGLAVGSVSWSDAVATDNTGSLSVSPDIASGSNFTVGVTTVTYNTTDPSGNPATCSFTVTISGMENITNKTIHIPELAKEDEKFVCRILK